MAALVAGRGGQPTDSVPQFKTLELRFHFTESDSLPIMCVDCHPTKSRVLTTGIDGAIKLWDVDERLIGALLRMNKVDPSHFTRSWKYTCTLLREDRGDSGCNVARWSPAGGLVAAVYTDGEIVVWKHCADEAPAPESSDSEIWKPMYSLRAGRELNDVAWSPDSRYLISCNIDGSVCMYDVLNQKSVHGAMLPDAHESKCQALVWDPWNEFVASAGIDRKVKIYTVSQTKRKKKEALGSVGLFESHTVGSTDPRIKFKGELASPWIRRMSWSLDGLLLAVPCASFEVGSSKKSGVFVFMRSDLATPSAIFVTDKSAVIGAKFAPCLLKPLDQEGSNPELQALVTTATSWGPAEYRYALATWTKSTVEIYTSDSLGARYSFEDLHYELISDVSWNKDATQLYVTSHDAYITAINFPEKSLGGGKYELFTIAASSMAPPMPTVAAVVEEPKVEEPKVEEPKATVSPVGTTNTAEARSPAQPQPSGDDVPGPVNLSVPVSVSVPFSSESALAVAASKSPAKAASPVAVEEAPSPAAVVKGSSSVKDSSPVPVTKAESLKSGSPAAATSAPSVTAPAPTTVAPAPTVAPIVALPPQVDTRSRASRYPVTCGVVAKLRPLAEKAEELEKQMLSVVKSVTRGAVVRKKRRIEVDDEDGEGQGDGAAGNAVKQQATEDALEAALLDD